MYLSRASMRLALSKIFNLRPTTYRDIVLRAGLEKESTMNGISDGATGEQFEIPEQRRVWLKFPGGLEHHTEGFML